MSYPKGVTFEGQPLEDFFEKNEDDYALKKGREFIRDGFDIHALKKNVFFKQRSKKERNGRVIILGQLDKNNRIAGKLMKKAIDEKDFLRATIIVLMTTDKGQRKNTMDIADVIVYEAGQFGTELNTIVLERKLRFLVGKLRKSRFSEYLFHYQRNSRENRSGFNQLMFDFEKGQDLSFDKAFELSKEIVNPILHPELKSIREKKKLLRKQQKLGMQTVREPVDDSPPQAPVLKINSSELEEGGENITTENRVDFIEEIILKLNNAVNKTGGVVFSGDIHINISLGG